MPILQLDPEKPLGRKMQNLQTQFYLMLGLPLVLFLVAYLQAQQPNHLPPYHQNNTIIIAAWVVVAGIAFYSWKLYREEFKHPASSAAVEQKFDRYRNVSLKAYALQLVAMLITSAGLWLTGAVLFGALFSVVLILMASFRPTAEQFIERMKLTPDEQQQLLRQE
jgi:uncharacterized membrane protein YgdD (TMEM256/DUF423 family)